MSDDPMGLVRQNIERHSHKLGRLPDAGLLGQLGELSTWLAENDPKAVASGIAEWTKLKADVATALDRAERELDRKFEAHRDEMQRERAEHERLMAAEKAETAKAKQEAAAYLKSAQEHEASAHQKDERLTRKLRALDAA